MDDFKTAPDNSLGHRLEIWSKGTTQGHVPRNMRMCLLPAEYERSFIDPVKLCQIAKNTR